MAGLLMSTSVNGGLTAQSVSTGDCSKFSVQLVGEGSVEIDATADPAALADHSNAAWWFVVGIDSDPAKEGEIYQFKTFASHLRYRITAGSPSVHVYGLV